MRRRWRIDPLNAAASLAFMLALAAPAAADNPADVTVEQLMPRADASVGELRRLYQDDQRRRVPPTVFNAVLPRIDAI